MNYNYNKLNGKIKEVFGTQEKFAKALGLSSTSVNYRLNNKKQFMQEEIIKSIELLNIPPEEIVLYFFTKSVEKTQ